MRDSLDDIGKMFLDHQEEEVELEVGAERKLARK